MIAQTYNPAGIDKLCLTTREYYVSDKKPLNIQPLMKFAGQDETNVQDGLLFEVNSEPVFGSKAFVNTEQFSANINSHGLSVTFNPSKVLHEYNLLTDSQALDTVCISIEDQLAQNGIHLNLKEAGVSRLDIAKQSNMPRLVSYYAPAFDQMRFKGVRSNNVNHGAETFSIRNKTVEACFYDKQKELNPAGMPSDFMRAELRLRNTNGVRRYTGTKNLGQIIQMGQEGWNYVYTDYLTKKVFSDYSEQLTFDYAGLDALVSHLVSVQPKGQITAACEVIGIKQIFDQIGIDRFLSAFTPYMDGSTIRRHRKRLMARAALSSMIGNPISTIDLIDEIKQIFIHGLAA
jgi:hypothetical protein